MLGLNEDLPLLQQRVGELSRELEQVVGQAAPWVQASGAGQPTQPKLAQQLARLAGPLLNLTAGIVLEACVVGLYLLFLLLEGSRFPDLVRKAYAPSGPTKS